MDLNQMRVFLQVAQQESFDKVAQKNYVSQRAVSQLVKRLENEVNVKLFFRKSNSILLTPAGVFFAQRVEEYLNSIGSTINVMKRIDREGDLNLKVGYFSIFDGVLMRDLILSYTRAKVNPTIHFSTIEESVEHLLADLSLSKVDCGFINNYGEYHFINRSLFNFVDVYENEMVLAISRLNPLSEKTLITENDLIGNQLLYYSTEVSDYMRETFLETIGNENIQHSIKRVSSIEQLMIECSLGSGLAYVTKGLYERSLSCDPNLVFRKILSTKERQNYIMQLVYRKDNPSLALKKFGLNLQSTD